MIKTDEFTLIEQAVTSSAALVLSRRQAGRKTAKVAFRSLSFVFRLVLF